MRNPESAPVEFVEINGVNLEKRNVDEAKTLFNHYMGPGSDARLIFYVSGKMSEDEKNQFYNEMAQFNEAIFMELDETIDRVFGELINQSSPVIPSMTVENSVFAEISKVMGTQNRPSSDESIALFNKINEGMRNEEDLDRKN